MSKKKVIGTLATSAVLLAGLSGVGTTAFAASKAAPPLTIVTAPNGNFQDNFNPYSSTANPGTQGSLYESLFYFDNVSGKQFNLLGTGFTFSNNNKTLTVNLHNGVKWSDGKAFTAADVVFSFDMLKKYPASDTNGIWAQLSSVKAVGTNKVVFTFKSSNAPFAEQYVLGGTWIVPQHIWSSLGDPSKATVTKPVGTGPYTLDSFTPQLYKMSANAHYYLGAPQVKEVAYPAYSSNQSADLALASGEIQWSGIDIPNIQKTYTQMNPHNHYFFPPNNVVELYPNLSNPLLSQLPVRQAISAAINRSVLSAKGETGYEGVASPTDLVLPNNNAWVNKSLPASEMKFKYSTSTAASILAKAGFKKDSKGILAKNGQELAFSIDVVAGWSDWDEDAFLIEQELQPLGIKITVNQMQYADYYNAIMPSGKAKANYDLAISWTNTGPLPYTEFYNEFDSNGNFNVEGLKNASIDKALSNYAATSNTAAQKKDINLVEKYAVEQLPAIPLLQGATWYEYNDAYYTGWPTASNSWINPAPFTYQAAAIVLDHLKVR